MKEYNNSEVFTYIKKKEDISQLQTIDDIALYIALAKISPIYKDKKNSSLIKQIFYYKQGDKFCADENICKILEKSNQALLYYEQYIDIIKVIFSCSDSDAVTYFKNFTTNPNDKLHEVFRTKTKNWFWLEQKLMWEWLTRNENEYPKYEECLHQAIQKYETIECLLKTRR